MTKESTGLMVRTPEDVRALVELMRGARNLPRHIGTPADLALIIATAADLGLPATTAIRGLHLINGKVELDASLMRGLMKRAGYRIGWHSTRTPDVEVTLKIWDAGRDKSLMPDHMETFTIEMAERAGLLRNDTWRKYPEAMLKARCTSAAVRNYCPEVTMGSVYAPGEISITQDGPPGSTLPDGDTRGPESAPAAVAEFEEVPEVEIPKLPEWARLVAEVVPVGEQDEARAWFEGWINANALRFSRLPDAQRQLVWLGAKRWGMASGWDRPMLDATLRAAVETQKQAAELRGEEE